MLLERTVSHSASWATTTDVWRIERDDPQKLSSLLEQVGFAITINPDKTLTTANSKTVWSYKGKDKGANRFILLNLATEKYHMIARDDYCDTGVVRYDDQLFVES